MKGVSTLIQLIFRTEDPEWIEDLARIEGMALELNWKTKGGGYSNEILNFRYSNLLLNESIFLDTIYVYLRQIIPELDPCPIFMQFRDVQRFTAIFSK